MLDEVDAADDGEPFETGLDPGHVEPGGEEAGSLGSLSGGDNDQHGRHSLAA